jgi:hypothetical protein
LLQRSIAFDVVELLPAHASAIAINIGHESALSLVVDARLVITVQVHYNLPLPCVPEPLVPMPVTTQPSPT